MRLDVESFNSAEYTLNTLDSVSQVLSGNITLTTAPANLNTRTRVHNQAGGRGTIILSAPNLAMTGNVYIEFGLANLPYLHHD